MPWEGVTVTDERQRFLEDCRPKHNTVSLVTKTHNVVHLVPVVVAEIVTAIGLKEGATPEPGPVQVTLRMG